MKAVDEDGKLIVQVTEDDINLGQREIAGACPIAIALTRKLKRPCEVYPCIKDYCAGQFFVNDTRSGITIKGRLPAIATRFAIMFDNDKPDCQPFEFELIV
jgi:hypothetical protein